MIQSTRSDRAFFVGHFERNQFWSIKEFNFSRSKMAIRSLKAYQINQRTRSVRDFSSQAAILTNAHPNNPILAGRK